MHLVARCKTKGKPPTQSGFLLSPLRLRYWADGEKFVRDTYVLIGSICAERELAVAATSNQHVIDLTVERQRQRVRTTVTVRLSATHQERPVLSTSQRYIIDDSHCPTM